MKRSALVAVPTVLAFYAGCGGMIEDRQDRLVHKLTTSPTLALVTIDCGDGYPTTATVDTDTVSDIQESLQAMVDNPAGMLCTLSTAPVTTTTVLTASGTSNRASSSTPFVVGGGQYAAGNIGGCVLNFGLSGHVDSNGVFHGTQTVTNSNSATQPAGCTQGHVKADVSCMTVVGNQAVLQGPVTEATGSLAGLQGQMLTTHVTDNGRPSQGAPPDSIEQDDVSGCGTVAGGSFVLINGNITVRTN